MMKQIFVNIKQAGKKKDVLAKKPYLIDEDTHSLRELLIWFTRYEVEQFNSRSEQPLITYFSDDNLADLEVVGKIDFGCRKGEKNADLSTSVEVTISAFEDNLVRVFLNDTELKELDGSISLVDGDVLTFVRLTFLAGRMW